MKSLALRKAKINAVGVVGLEKYGKRVAKTWRHSKILQRKNIEVLNTDVEEDLRNALTYTEKRINQNLL